MRRTSSIALWTLASSASVVLGCANILGFQDFSIDGGDPSVSQGGSNASNGGGNSQGSGSGNTGAQNSNASGGNNSNNSNNGGGSTSVSMSGQSGITSSTSSNPGGSSMMSMGTSNTSSSGMTSTNRMSSSSTSSAVSQTSAPPGTCSFNAASVGTAFNGNGSFTFYFFGQGTAMQNGKFKTACGYAGTETGSGQSAVDTVSNIANSSPAKNTYFAAIPGTSSGNFNTVTACGACVEITNGGTKIVATVIDECPTSSNPACTTGHLDLSTQAFDALGYSTGNPSGTTWKFVPCPTTGNIQAVQNANGQYYLQNSVYPITQVNGQGPTNFGYFNVNSGSATVTNVLGQMITINIPSGGGDTGGNFTNPGGCY